MTTDDAIDYCGGSASELARRLGISRQAIDNWGRWPPPGRQIQIEHMTGGALRAEYVPAGMQENETGRA